MGLLKKPGRNKAHRGRFVVRVNAAPEKGKANKRVCRVLSQFFGVRAKDVAIVAGPGNRDKTVFIEGLTAAEAQGKLSAIGV